MSQSELLIRVVRVLDDAGIDYMVTGSTVSSIQGEPRSTHDIDVVLALTEAGVNSLLAAFPTPEFYLDEMAVREAIERKDMFNLLQPDTGEKVDFWLLTDDDFDQARFRRKVTAPFEGKNLKISRPEDTILMKLKWCELSGGSEKQFQDALRIFEVQADHLDQAHLEHWATVLGLTEMLVRLRREAAKT
jgi:hypothetical protein